MKFDVYGRFRLEVQRENDTWVVYRLDLGKRVRANDFIVPSTLETNEIATFLDELFMSYPDPGKASNYYRKSRRKCFYEVFLMRPKSNGKPVIRRFLSHEWRTYKELAAALSSIRQTRLAERSSKKKTARTPNG